MSESMDANDRLTEGTILENLKSHPLWTLNERGQLSRKMETKNFQTALNFIHEAGAVAEHYAHHPDIHLTNYKHVELVLFTHSAGGVTAQDFKLVKALDALDVVYALTWKKAHPDLAAYVSPITTKLERPAHGHGHAPPAVTVTATHHKIMHHSQDEHFARDHLPHAAMSHASALSATGAQIHPHDFRVHTSHSTERGHGDAIYNMRHHEKEVDCDVKVPASKHVPDETWNKMAACLQTLVKTGFDVGQAENFLPMIEDGAIHPSLECELFHFYKHMLHRLEPEARSTEPVAVVEAVLGFVEGYEELKSIIAP